jgi:hypothetical protein
MKETFVFVSRPNDLDSEQQKTVKKLERIFEPHNIKVRTIGATDIPNSSPMNAVEDLMRECNGVLALGFPQIEINQGVSKPGTDKESSINNIYLPTPWNHIEITLAFALKLPLFRICDLRIKQEGLFDRGAMEGFVHCYNLSKQDWLKDPKFLNVLNSWIDKVKQTKSNKELVGDIAETLRKAAKDIENIQITAIFG